MPAMTYTVMHMHTRTGSDVITEWWQIAILVLVGVGMFFSVGMIAHVIADEIREHRKEVRKDDRK